MDKKFKIVFLGCTGGPKEINLSGYLLISLKNKEGIVFDAGTLLAGLELAMEKKSIEKDDFEMASPFSLTNVFQNIKAVLISHAHLDHVSALVVNSPADVPKPILGRKETIDNIRDHLFNNKIWPNYGNEGNDPLSRYTYVRVPLNHKFSIPNTKEMSIEAFPLSHPGQYPSTAFLLEESGAYVLYLGDTSSDQVEKEKHLKKIWEAIAPLIQQKRLRAIFLECSFCHKNAPKEMFGHLDTQFFPLEMEALQKICGPIEGLKVIVTHRKDDMTAGGIVIEDIKKELLENNKLKVDYYFPNQGESILI